MMKGWAMEDAAAMMAQIGRAARAAAQELAYAPSEVKRAALLAAAEAVLARQAEILAANEYHSLPVCKEEELVGIITDSDIIRYFLEQY